MRLQVAILNVSRGVDRRGKRTPFMYAGLVAALADAAGLWRGLPRGLLP